MLRLFFCTGTFFCVGFSIAKSSSKPHVKSEWSGLANFGYTFNEAGEGFPNLEDPLANKAQAGFFTDNVQGSWVGDVYKSKSDSLPFLHAWCL